MAHREFPALADAKAAAGPLSLTADVEGKVWLLTLGPKGTPMHGGSMVTEIGPLVEVSAPEYLLGIYHGGARWHFMDHGALGRNEHGDFTPPAAGIRFADKRWIIEVIHETHADVASSAIH